MYFIDRKQLERTLLYLEGLLQEFERHSFDSFIEQLGMERIVQMIIESILDCGNMIIDGFIMRDPGSFEDIIDILVDEKVLPVEESNNYKTVIKARSMLVKDYLNIDHDQLTQVIQNNHQSLELFSTRVREYLDESAEVANAFSNDD